MEAQFVPSAFKQRGSGPERTLVKEQATNPWLYPHEGESSHVVWPADRGSGRAGEVEVPVGSDEDGEDQEGGHQVTKSESRLRWFHV